MSPKSVLKKYWGYDDFRPKQLDIIESVLQDVDTIALLTTGGGKSLCFQIPAILKSGVTIVISPLIALMKDQVDSLKAKGIPAEAIYSGMTYRTIDRILDNAVFGHLKLLYLSPERLLTDLALARIKAMNISLVAIDEAHCISKWGHDFRPSYLRIAEIREWHPKTAFIALTATATPKVLEDMQEHLQMKNPKLFNTSFGRPNLAVNMSAVDTKDSALIRLLKGTQSCAIVYVYSRKDSRTISDKLNKHGILSDFYHAGLDQKTRTSKQTAWMEGRMPVMVCTNAFGMGIDKPDVRYIVHMHIPENIEGYYQEIGRAGRDGHSAKAYMFYHDTDKIKMIQRIERSFPPIALIRRVYQSLGGYLDLATGGGQYESFDFDMIDFAKKMNIQLIDVHHCLKVLQREEYIDLSDQKWQSGAAWIKASSRAVHDYIINHPKNGKVLSVMLRLYQSVGQQPTVINEGAIARQAEMNIDKVVSRLTYMHKEGIVDYSPRKELPQLTYIKDRIEAKNLLIDNGYLTTLKERKLKAAKTMIQLIQHPRCRQQNILRYFGEKNTACGICDRCLLKKEMLERSRSLIAAVHLLESGSQITEDLMRHDQLITYLLDEEIIVQKGQSFYKK